MASDACPACQASPVQAFRARGGLSIVRCLGCASCRLNGGRGERTDGFAYDSEYFESWDLIPDSPAWKLRRATASMRLQSLRSMGAISGTLLDVGAAGGYFVELACKQGFDARGVEISDHAVEVANAVVPGRIERGTLESIDLDPDSLDVVTLFDVLEHLPDPRWALDRIARWLKPGGALAMTTPDVDSLSARLMAGAWPHYKEEHLFYPSRRGLRMLLDSAGFEIVLDRRALKCLSVGFTAPLFERYPVAFLTPAMSALHRVLPGALRDAAFRVSIGERLTIGKKR